jgi:hypothetical protein
MLVNAEGNKLGDGLANKTILLQQTNRRLGRRASLFTSRQVRSLFAQRRSAVKPANGSRTSCCARIFGGYTKPLRPSTVLVIEKGEMLKVLHEQHALSDQFIAFMLARNIRIEEDLIDQLFNSSEKRLARTLLLLARYGNEDQPHGLLPKVSQETLAEMVGTTRSRVNFFMNKFRDLGFIKYNGGIEINNSLLSVVLHE